MKFFLTEEQINYFTVSGLKSQRIRLFKIKDQNQTFPLFSSMNHLILLVLISPEMEIYEEYVLHIKHAIRQMTVR